ncbi:MAG: di-trans,poly-cis-decaprenylcistransferase, partial [Ureaplasma sp.]|nr:di-trans,poly-cis-decaprenylcistransferase [Ureaplasma sp.]
MNNLRHIGFIMDGNGRWAKKQNKLRTYGHKIGADKIKDVLLWCIKYNIQSVSMYAFSLENWKRSKSEVNFLMNLILKKIVNKKTISFLNENNIRFIWNCFE